MVEYNKLFVKLDLKAFNSKNIYYVKANELTSYQIDYLKLLVDDYNEKNDGINYRAFYDIMTSRVLSEIEGTLKVENAPTKKRR